MKLLALLTVLLLRRSVTSETSEDVGACLLASHSKGIAAAGHQAPRCDAQRDCAGVSFGDDRSCLDTAVPWLTPHAQVKCCFRCCLAYWQRELGLTEILEDWEADIRDHKVQKLSRTHPLLTMPAPLKSIELRYIDSAALTNIIVCLKPTIVKSYVNSRLLLDISYPLDALPHVQLSSLFVCRCQTRQA